MGVKEPRHRGNDDGAQQPANKEPITMNHRIWAALLAALTIALVGSGLVTGSPALAGKQSDRDQRPCVSVYELMHAGTFAGRTELEARWEVSGLGRRMADLDELPIQPLNADVRPGDRVVAYPACGYRDAEAGTVVIYNKHREWHDVFWWKVSGATLHGHERHA